MTEDQKPQNHTTRRTAAHILDNSARHSSFLLNAASRVLGDTGGLVPGHSDFNCPVCDAISPDYCQIRQCRWDVIDPKGSGVSRGEIISGR